MKILSKTILILLGIFLIIIYAFSLNNESLHILIENTENTYYADVLIDKELVLNQRPTTIIDSDQSTDMNILKNFEYEGKKAMQMNTYVEYSGKPTDYRCRQIGNACTFTLSSKMPETVQLVLMDDAYNFYISDEIYKTKDNYVKLDFNTMEVTYNRNTQTQFLPYIIGLICILEYAVIYIKQYNDDSSTPINDFIINGDLRFEPYFMYQFSVSIRTINY